MAGFKENGLGNTEKGVISGTERLFPDVSRSRQMKKRKSQKRADSGKAPSTEMQFASSSREK
jgi:hypothetical protein